MTIQTFLARIASLPAAAALAAMAAFVPPSVAEGQCPGRWITTPEDSGFEVWLGGSFSIGGSEGIVSWTGTGPLSQLPVPSPFLRPVRTLVTLPDGSIAAAGDYFGGGPIFSSAVMRWTGSTWLPAGSQVSGSITCLAVLPNGDLIAGGAFSAAGVSYRVARRTGASWASLGTGVNNFVRALAVLPNGDLVAAGDFTTAGGVAANRIARWDGSNWSPLGSGMNFSVEALAVLPNGDLVAGGQFSSAGGVSANRVARWNGSTWSPLGTGTNGTVRSLAVLPNGDLVAGGAFTFSFQGGTAKFVARWSGTSGWVPLAWFPNNNQELEVDSVVALPNGHVIARSYRPASFNPSQPDPGASFAHVWNGSSWSPIYNSSGDADGPRAIAAIRAPALNAPIRALVRASSGTLVAGGDFTTVGGVAASRIASWNGSSWSAFGSGLNGPVHAIVMLPNGDVVAGGDFTTAGGVAASRIARWNGSSWSALGSGLNGPVNAVVVLPSGDVVAGGDFTTAGGAAAGRIARWNGTSWSSSGLGSGLNGPVHALAVSANGNVLVGGEFTSANGLSARRIARWTGSSWSALGAGLGGGSGTLEPVLALAVSSNGDVVASGRFWTSGGSTVNRIARWNGTSWSALGSGFSGGNGAGVMGVAVLDGGQVVAGGDFTTAGGAAANCIARWNGSSWSALGAGMSGGPVHALATLPSGELVAGGTFIFADGVTSCNLARWTDTGIPWVARQPAAGSSEAGAIMTLTAACAPGYGFGSPVTYQWRRDGANISDGAGGASAGGGTVSGASGSLTATGLSATLTIAGIRPSDAGQYTVVFANACGGATSAAAAVTVTNGCPADLTGGGSVDGDDLGQLLAAWGSGPGPADLNGDGFVDGNDLGILLAAWGPCVP